ncbi:tetraspanin-3-like [Betta splendens]|uniref:Tetraspanin n=1 Tax=Betta splendens TaxID=158456 RepID=A0A6P7LKU7_BETSP|nr:tetraspanin-3-like [Betta splendens]
MCEGRKGLKTALQLVCQLLWVLGILVGLSGVYLLMTYKHSRLFFSDSCITLSCSLALASAVLLLVSGSFGSCLSFKDSTFMQGLFVYLLFMVFCLESTSSALAYYRTTELDAEMAPLPGVFLNYTGSSQDPNSRAVDSAQEKFQCCGVHGYRDWLETTWFKDAGGLQVPLSCCNTTFPSCNGTVHQPWQLYTEGCQKKLEMSVHFALMLIIWGLPLVLLVEVTLVLIVIQLMRNPSYIHYRTLTVK